MAEQRKPLEELLIVRWLSRAATCIAGGHALGWIRKTSLRGSVDHQQNLVAIDQVTSGHVDGLDDAILGRTQFIVHLHRLQN